jgi:hypothetical protein
MPISQEQKFTVQPENLLQEKILRSHVRSESIAFWFN